MNPALILRHITADDIPRIAGLHLACWKTTYKGLVPAGFPSSQTISDFTAGWRDRLRPSRPGIHVAALNKDLDIIGFASAGPEKTAFDRSWSELGAIYIHPDFRKKGAGNALFGRILKELRGEYYKGMISWTLAGSPAGAFYKKMGGAVQGSKMESIGDIQKELVAFQWIFHRAWNPIAKTGFRPLTGV